MCLCMPLFRGPSPASCLMETLLTLPVLMLTSRICHFIHKRQRESSSSCLHTQLCEPTRNNTRPVPNCIRAGNLNKLACDDLCACDLPNTLAYTASESLPSGHTGNTVAVPEDGAHAFLSAYMSASQVHYCGKPGTI